MIRYLNKAVGREIFIKKKGFLYFGGTSYLSLQTHFRFKRWVLKGVLKYGVHHGASRKSNLRISLFNKVEKTLCKQAKAPASLLVSSGYLAGQITAKQFLSDTYTAIYLPHTHSALKINPQAEETAYNALENKITEAIAHKTTPLVYLDSIDFFGNHYPTFECLTSLDLKDCIVIVDDSHALGISSPDGCGSYHILSQIACKELIVTASLGKGLGVSGGVIFCDPKRLQSLKNSPSYGGASPPALAGLYAYHETPEIYQKQRAQLQKNIQRFIKGVHKIEFFNGHPGHPAFGFQSPEISRELENMGFLLTNFPYPTDKDPIMSRIVIAAGHKKKDIEALCKAINTLLD